MALHLKMGKTWELMLNNCTSDFSRSPMLRVQVEKQFSSVGFTEDIVGQSQVVHDIPQHIDLMSKGSIKFADNNQKYE